MLNPGDILNGRYAIIAKLGQGGFGQTYKAKILTQPGHPICVVKEITPPITLTPRLAKDLEQRFVREAKSLVSLGEHPQIPKLFDYFQKNNKFYLVQEYIEGYDLSEEIEIGKPPLPESQVIQILTDVLEILQAVHQQNMIHRDIKPSNLRRRTQDQKIVLLDFGAVKELTSVLINSDETSDTFTRSIGTPGYMPPEQQHGNPQFSSDIYSLGMICIQALTGIHPRTLPTDPSTGNIIWRYSTIDHNMIDVNPALEQIINKMVCYHFRERYKSVSEVLEELRYLPNQPASTPTYPAPKKTPIISKKKVLVMGLGLTILIVGVWQFIQLRPKACPPTIGDDISCGEEILSRGQSASIAEKTQGAKAYSKGKYQEALQWFEKARQKLPSDPETLIYLNNAKLAATKTPYYTIAVAVPLGNPADGGDAGKEILRGVAQIQNEVNQNLAINGLGLRVVIGDDYNNPDRAQQVAKKLGEQPDILGIVGHYTSGSTRAALPVYQDYHLALISPTSTAQNLTQDSTVFFRTAPSDSAAGQALAKYLYQKAKQKKVAVFYNPNSNYSKSLYEQFSRSFDELGGLVVRQFDLSQAIFDADEVIAQAIQRGATGFLLFPDAKENPYSYPNTLKLIRANQNRYAIAGGDSLYTTDILQEKRAAENIIVAIPWHHLSDKHQNFIHRVQKLWGGDVSWRTATAADATQVLTLALKDQYSLSWMELLQAFFDPSVRRLYLLASLKQPNFKTQGATGEISFTPKGDRLQSVIELVKVAPSQCSVYGYIFVPLSFSTEQIATLCR